MSKGDAAGGQPPVSLNNAGWRAVLLNALKAYSEVREGDEGMRRAACRELSEQAWRWFHDAGAPLPYASPVRAALERLCHAGESVQETRYWESAADPAGASVRSFQALEQLRAALASARAVLDAEPKESHGP